MSKIIIIIVRFHLNDSKNVKESLNTLKKLNEPLLDVGGSILAADDGNIFPLDLLAIAIINRTLSLNRGFYDSIDGNNFICAAPLVRLQLDNLLRFYASSISDDIHVFAKNVLKGDHVRQMKSSDGEKMTDSYLVEKLTKHYNWIKPLYQETSGYIHFSNLHIFNSVNNINDKNGLFQFIISDKDSNYVNEDLKQNSIDAMVEISKTLLLFLNVWVNTKNNPQTKVE